MTATNWIVSSGQQVSTGDVVALEFFSNQYGEIIGADEDHGVPKVTVTHGPQKGKTLTVWPHQIIAKRHPRPSDIQQPT